MREFKNFDYAVPGTQDVTENSPAEKVAKKIENFRNPQANKVANNAKSVDLRGETLIEREGGADCGNAGIFTVRCREGEISRKIRCGR